MATNGCKIIRDRSYHWYATSSHYDEKCQDRRRSIQLEILPSLLAILLGHTADVELWLNEHFRLILPLISRCFLKVINICGVKQVLRREQLSWLQLPHCIPTGTRQKMLLVQRGSSLILNGDALCCDLGFVSSLLKEPKCLTVQFCLASEFLQTGRSNTG